MKRCCFAEKMDAESSSKFIGSLTKFLQSLCNGYVDFENGVELIGHIYLSVDTGKKIDYILNEKVCKSDNSVTFISNSFHAQPLDKSKSVSSKKTTEDKTSDVALRKDDDAVLGETGDGTLRSTQMNIASGRNHTSLPSSQITSNRSSAVKRSGSPLTPRKAPTPPQRRPSPPPSHSQRRSQLQASKGSLGSPVSSKNVPSSPSSSSLDNAPSPSSRLKANQPSTESASGDPESDILVPPNLLAVAQVPDLSSFLGATSNEGQDVTAHEAGLATSDDETKPDTDITFIKEEFLPSASSCAQANSGGQSSGRSMEEQVHDSGGSSGLYPVMLHQNAAAFPNPGGVFSPVFPPLGNATATSTSTSQAAADLFANPVPGTSNQDSSSGDPSEVSQHGCSPFLQLGQGSAELIPVQQLSLQATAAHGSYCKRCMFYCSNVQVLFQHISKCRATSKSPSKDDATSVLTAQAESCEELKRESKRAGSGEMARSTDLLKPYKCSKCGRSYQLAQSLQRHRWKCDKSRPMHCALCNAVFFRADIINAHMMSMHGVDIRTAPKRGQDGLMNG